MLYELVKQRFLLVIYSVLVRYDSAHSVCKANAGITLNQNVFGINRHKWVDG